MKQIFIFSLPRSGSTLLQRVLMGHDKIASTSEPWILLPQVYSLKTDGHLSEYSSRLSSKGINNLIEKLPNKKADYYESLKVFMSDIHRKLAINDEVYFLDKTPRYYYIIDEIRAIFPEAKFIFLFRSPEQIYASMISTWSERRLKPFLGSYYDLTVGFKKLSEGFSKHQEHSIHLNYEHLVSQPEIELRKILEYLELEFAPEMLKAFVKQDVKASLGDPTGVKNYSDISSGSLKKWKTIFNTHTKKRVVINTLRKIDENAVTIQGYNKSEIINSVKNLKTKFTSKEFRDLYDYISNTIVRKYHFNLLFGKAYRWTRKKFFS